MINSINQGNKNHFSLCIDWEFLKLVMIKTIISFWNINSIMACINKTNFVVIINGLPTQFFNAYRGLR